MQRPQAVLFDLDGTLLDTEVLYQKAWKMAFEYYGYHLQKEQLLTLRSLDHRLADKQFEQWLGDASIGDAIRSKRDEFMKGWPLLAKPGAHEIAKALREKDIPYCVCSATPIDFLKEKLVRTGLAEDFPTYFSARNVAFGKPAPDVYLAACEALRLDPRRCIAVEDAPSGFQSAFAAGLNVIFIVDLSEPDDFIREHAYKVVRRLDEIIALFP